jgi:hypothetical protein
MIQCPPSGPVEKDDSFWLGSLGSSGDIQNSLSLYNVHFFMFMGWDGGIINTMLHMVKSDRGQNRGCACRCSYLSEIWFASSFENQMF